MNNSWEKIFNFLHQVENLKSTLRYNFTKAGRKESTAEHSWRLALLSFVVAREAGIEIDIARATKIAIAHDLAEAITGDIDAVKIAEGKIDKATKDKWELTAMKKLKKYLPQEAGKEIFGLWQEYQQGQTREAKFIKALDKIETLTQIAEMGYKRYDKPQFIANYADKAVADYPALKPALKVIKKELKREFGKGGIEWKKEYD